MSTAKVGKLLDAEIDGFSRLYTQVRMADSSACVRFFGVSKVAFGADGFR